MSVHLMGHVWADNSIKSRADLLVLLAIADFSGDNKPAFPSIDTLAQKSRCTQRGVQKALTRLIESKKLSVEYGSGPHGTNLYKIIVGGVNAVHPEPSVPKKEPKKETLAAPKPSGTVINSKEPSELALSSEGLSSRGEYRGGKEEVPIPKDLQTGAFAHAWSDWHDHLKMKRKPATRLAKERQLKKLVEMGVVRAIAAIEHSIGKNWQGIYEEQAERFVNGRNPSPPIERDYHGWAKQFGDGGAK